MRFIGDDDVSEDTRPGQAAARAWSDTGPTLISL